MDVVILRSKGHTHLSRCRASQFRINPFFRDPLCKENPTQLNKGYALLSTFRCSSGLSNGSLFSSKRPENTTQKERKTNKQTNKTQMLSTFETIKLFLNILTIKLLSTFYAEVKRSVYCDFNAKLPGHNNVQLRKLFLSILVSF